MAAAEVHNFSEVEHNQGSKHKQNEVAERLYDSAYPMPGSKTQNNLNNSNRADEARRPDTIYRTEKPGNSEISNPAEERLQNTSYSAKEQRLPDTSYRPQEPSRPDTSFRPEEPRRSDTSVPSDRVKEDDLIRLAKEIIATNKIPKELKDALDAKQTPDGKVLDINRLNEILRGLHSTLQIDLGRDADGKGTMGLRDRQSGEILDTAKSSESQNDKAAAKETLNKLADEIIRSAKIPDWLRESMRQTPKPGEKGLDIDELNKTLREKGSTLELTRTDTSDGLLILELRDRSTKEVKDLAWAPKPAIVPTPNPIEPIGKVADEKSFLHQIDEVSRKKIDPAIIRALLVYPDYHRSIVDSTLRESR